MKKVNNVSKQKTKKTNVEEGWWSDTTRGVSRAAGNVAGGIGQMGAEMGKGYRSGARAVAGHDYDSLAKLAQKVIDKKVHAYDLDPADRSQLMDFINNGGVPAGTKTQSGHNVSAGDINNALSSLSQAQGGGEVAPDANSINSALGNFNQWQGDNGEVAPDPSAINAALGGMSNGGPAAPDPSAINAALGGMSNGGVRAPQTSTANSMVSDMISRLKQLAGVFTRSGDKKSADAATTAANTVARIEPTAADDANVAATNAAAPQPAAADNTAASANAATADTGNATTPASQFQQMMQQGKGSSQSADPAAAQAFINKLKRKPGDVSGTAPQNTSSPESEWAPEVGINSADDEQDQSWIADFNDVEITPRELNTTIASIDKNAAPEIAKAVVAAVTPDGTTDIKTVLSNVTPEQQDIIKKAINYKFNPSQGNTAFSPTPQNNGIGGTTPNGGNYNHNQTPYGKTTTNAQSAVPMNSKAAPQANNAKKQGVNYNFDPSKGNNSFSTNPQNTGIGGTTPNGGNYNHNQTPYGKTTTNAPSKVPMNIVTPSQAENLKKYVINLWASKLNKKDKADVTDVVDKLLRPLLARPEQLKQLGWNGQEIKNKRLSKGSTADARNNVPIILPTTPPSGLSRDQFNRVTQVINQYNEYIKRVNPLANNSQQPAQPAPQADQTAAPQPAPTARGPIPTSNQQSMFDDSPVAAMRRMLNAVNGKRK